MKLHIFESGWRKIKQDPAGWGALCLFALGITTLLALMKLLPYSAPYSA